MIKEPFRIKLKIKIVLFDLDEIDNHRMDNRNWIPTILPVLDDYFVGKNSFAVNHIGISHH